MESESLDQTALPTKSVWHTAGVFGPVSPENVLVSRECLGIHALTAAAKGSAPRVTTHGTPALLRGYPQGDKNEISRLNN